MIDITLCGHLQKVISPTEAILVCNGANKKTEYIVHFKKKVPVVDKYVIMVEGELDVTLLSNKILKVYVDKYGIFW